MYNLLRFVLGIIFSFFFRWKVIGAENVPSSGGLIIASNHVSLWDPPVVGTAIPRRIHFMAKEELFSNPIFARIISGLGAFPVKRGIADRTAIRTALTLLENGSILGIFPEGTRSKNGQLGSPEPGLAMLAVKAGVPVVPTAIIGTNKVFQQGQFFPKFKVIFGKPIMLSKDDAKKDGLEVLSLKVMDAIGRMLEEDNHTNEQSV
ncbi:lysophospholipid acyltransferase family protein [Sporomusa malonica]|uniref:1-acyl-sn-glycerol-3-phosphate acyltransferase n=1 Tax=Sporomusa malonica TaxID=112901 RepID=A0A1W2A9I2_9FIRM|nr:lysophospholipid acyltransferase family protein [Sporomusa malonica]SMC57300.1 1-acyl-sn-glycerol-3-phosphate acyltransferase [Sporomusa malonica]